MSLFNAIAAALGYDQSVGARGERAAADYLQRQGFRVLARNLRNRFGEIDIVAQAPPPDERAIVIVEVKTRLIQSEASRGNPPPEVRVDHHKQRKLTALACQLARRYKLTNHPIRFDVVGVDLEAGKKPVIRHHAGAFESHV